ncbi:hypothetical protein ACFSHO_03585 [Acinetobacter vivianii]
MKAYYSIADLQALELPGLPTTRRGLEKYVLNKQFKYREVASRGKGGIRKEYELNDELNQQIVLKQMKSEILTSPNYEQKLEVVVADSSLPNANDLLNWQREVAENRLFVVRFIQGNILNGIKKKLKQSKCLSNKLPLKVCLKIFKRLFVKRMLKLEKKEQ